MSQRGTPRSDLCGKSQTTKRNNGVKVFHTGTDGGETLRDAGQNPQNPGGDFTAGGEARVVRLQNQGPNRKSGSED